MNQFVEDMEAAMISVEAYAGRWFWRGPAVRASDIEDFQDVARATSVRLQWDSPLAYPVASDEEWYEANKNNPYYEQDWDDDE